MATPPKTTEEQELPATSRVLKFVKGDDGTQEAMASEWNHEQEKIELDERWLVTYADKMSLLCGLFVMLFAMSTIDRAKFQGLKLSAQKTFGVEGETVTLDPVVELESRLVEMKANLEQMQKEADARETENRALKAQIQQMENESASPPSSPKRLPAKRPK
jgi:flagellar motor protein MotB